jgi:hypothetical protein
MGEVIDIFGNVDQAWGDYTEFAHVLASDPSKLLDRAFHEEFARRYERWRKLFLRTDARDSGPEAA